MKKKSGAKRPSWEIVLETFANEWEKKSFVQGALFSGSRAYGTETKNSDIDVHIILHDSVTWRERGNVLIDGYLVEYFANPPRQLRHYRKQDFEQMAHTDARMFAQGTILFDKTGIVLQLQNEARAELQLSFKKLSPVEVELAKYALWDELDNLADLSAQRSPSYTCCHGLLLHSIVQTYRRYYGVEVGAPSKLFRYLNDDTFRHKYGLEDFPDPIFVKLVKACMRSTRLPVIRKLVDHVHRKMGGFEIDGWKVRSELSF